MVPLATDWIEVGSVSTGAGALVTAVLAFVTLRIAKRTKALAVETRSLTRETGRLAVATEEDVSASWRPVVICPDALRIPPNTGIDFGDITLRLTNVGRGPAINVLAVAESSAIVDRIHTNPAGFGVLEVGQTIDVTFPGHVIRDPAGQTLRFRVVIVYTDLGRHTFETDLRFSDPAPGSPHPDEITAATVSFNFRARDDVPVPVLVEDAPDDSRPWLAPKTNLTPFASKSVVGPPLAPRHSADDALGP